MSNSRILEIGIVGAGIAGLSAAAALRQVGHSIEIFERSSFANEVGAAITITPNATRCLEWWGFDFEKARGSEQCQARILDGNTLNIIAEIDVSDNSTRYGFKTWMFHRVDLHQGLKILALDKDSFTAPECVLRLGESVTHVDAEKGEITFCDGRKVTKDIVIVADGVHSNSVAEVAGTIIPPMDPGRSMFRFLLPMEKINADPDLKPWFQNQRTGVWCPFLPATKTTVMSYECRGGELLNVAVIHPSAPDPDRVHAWNAPATQEQLLNSLKGFHPTVIKLGKLADEIKLFGVRVRDPLPRCVKGKAVLIGDAAHPMLPNHAQGGASSLEDAAALATFLSRITPDERIEIRLKAYERFRMPRAATIQIMSNMTFEDAEEDGVAKIRNFYTGSLPALNAGTFSYPIRDFRDGYDVISNSQMALEAWRRGSDPSELMIAGASTMDESYSESYVRYA